MSEDTLPKDLESALFAHLVVSLAQSALIAMGKIVHPATNKAEVNLDAAQQTIDMIAMLDAKTRGNLSADEAQMMRQTLSMLQLNYVETAQGAPAPAAPEAAPEAPAPAPDAKPAEDPEKVKFRKSYG